MRHITAHMKLRLATYPFCVSQNTHLLVSELTSISHAFLCFPFHLALSGTILEEASQKIIPNKKKR
jgi:hypothetical protein